MGIYSLKDRKWIVEPARQRVTLFTDSVYMIGSDVGNLYRTDGTCIEEGAEDVTVQGNFIISRRAVYDKIRTAAAYDSGKMRVFGPYCTMRF